MLTLTILSLTAAGLLAAGALTARQQHCQLPAPARWRSCDVLTRRRSTVDQIHLGDHTPDELRARADRHRHLANGAEPATAIAVQVRLHHWHHAELLDDLAARRDIETRIIYRDLHWRRDHPTVRAAVRVWGLA